MFLLLPSIILIRSRQKKMSLSLNNKKLFYGFFFCEVIDQAVVHDGTNQNHMISWSKQGEEHSILLPKTYNLNPIMKKHRTNPHWRAFINNWPATFKSLKVMTVNKWLKWVNTCKAYFSVGGLAWTFQINAGY